MTPQQRCFLLQKLFLILYNLDMKKTTHKSLQKFRHDFLIEHRCKDHVILLGEHTPVLLSAPHGVRQFRNGKIKGAEPGTINTILHLHKMCNCHAIIKTKNNKDDANYDESSEYKTSLIKFVTDNKIKYVIDLHSLAAHSQCDINIGTNNGKNVETNQQLYRKLVKMLCDAGFNVYIDVPYCAGERTIAGSIKKKLKDIWTIQLEINSKIAWQQEGFEKYKKLLDTLATFIVEME